MISTVVIYKANNPVILKETNIRKLLHARTNLQVADVLTKVLYREQLRHLTRKIDLLNIFSPFLKGYLNMLMALLQLLNI